MVIKTNHCGNIPVLRGIIMKVGIVGLPQVGKTTIFKLLTQGRVDTSSWGSSRDAHIGIAPVPDSRLDKLAELVNPQKTTNLKNNNQFRVS